MKYFKFALKFFRAPADTRVGAVVSREEHWENG
jgi:hypothetical protein